MASAMSNRLRKSGQIVPRFAPQQEAHGSCAIGECADDRSRPSLCQFVDAAKGSTFAGKPSPWRASASISGVAVLAVMESSSTGWSAAGLVIGQQHGAEFVQLRVGGRQSIRGCASRAGGGALPAARADVRINGDMIARGRDRARRTQIQAAMAPVRFERECAQSSGVKLTYFGLSKLA